MGEIKEGSRSQNSRRSARIAPAETTEPMIGSPESGEWVVNADGVSQFKAKPPEKLKEDKAAIDREVKDLREQVDVMLDSDYDVVVEDDLDVVEEEVKRSPVREKYYQASKKHKELFEELHKRWPERYAAPGEKNKDGQISSDKVVFLENLKDYDRLLEEIRMGMEPIWQSVQGTMESGGGFLQPPK